MIDLIKNYHKVVLIFSMKAIGLRFDTLDRGIATVLTGRVVWVHFVI